MSEPVSVIICTYNDRIDILEQNLVSIVGQLRRKDDIHLIDMSSNDKIKNLASKYKVVKYISFKESRGLSESRNKGLELAKNPIVAFDDADAIPQQSWLQEISKAFDIKAIAIAGGKIIPLWEKLPPIWLAKPSIKNDFFSMLDLGDEPKITDRIIGANFAIHKERFKGTFALNLGRTTKGQMGGEETDLCQRAIDQGLKVYYTPHAIVKHHVSEYRISYKWLSYRAYYTGVSRAFRKGKPKPYGGKIAKSIWDYAFIAMIIVPYAFGYIKGLRMKK